MMSFLMDIEDLSQTVFRVRQFSRADERISVLSMDDKQSLSLQRVMNEIFGEEGVIVG